MESCRQDRRRCTRRSCVSGRCGWSRKSSTNTPRRRAVRGGLARTLVGRTGPPTAATRPSIRRRPAFGPPFRGGQVDRSDQPRQPRRPLLRASHARGWPAALPQARPPPHVRGGEPERGKHCMQVSKWLGHASFVTTLNVYADYIAENEGGKQAPLTRPLAQEAPVWPSPPRASNVVPLFGRGTAG